MDQHYLLLNDVHVAFKKKITINERLMLKTTCFITISVSTALANFVHHPDTVQ